MYIPAKKNKISRNLSIITKREKGSIRKKKVESGTRKYFPLKNSRQAHTRNYAIKRSNGKYISFIDQDDVWVPEKLEWQVEYIEKHGVDAVHGN